ncbi:putative Non-specific lipid-transfer protein-like protein [Cocos nucifera]|uniref:Putative Non-specific lipid-transfer protein-like protein n=1 Tax=Cocos nucifera TaxID=13894 RepID=A0A8K0I2C3_COCNU|nr:putative Non-specific lipid-transfer protein-like protein [Cocos nucifera]
MADLSVRLLVIAMVVLCSNCLAHADCMDVVISLSPCLDYIMNNRTSQPPSSECCLQLMTVVQSQPLCLCTILDGEVEAKLGIPIDKNRSLALPAACGVQTPPVSECKGLLPSHDLFIISKTFS